MRATLLCYSKSFYKKRRTVNAVVRSPDTAKRKDCGAMTDAALFGDGVEEPDPVEDPDEPEDPLPEEELGRAATLTPAPWHVEE